MLPVEIYPIQDALVLRARGSELLILADHVAALKNLKSAGDFSKYFLNEALVNRPARKLFEAWLRKDGSLWARIYKSVQTIESNPDAKNSKEASQPVKASDKPAVKETAKPAVKSETKESAAPKKAEKTGSKPASKSTDKKEAVKSSAKSSTKADSKESSKPAAKSSAKTATKAPAKSATKAPAKAPAKKTAAKPAAKSPSASKKSK